jgi:hypothetical protein
MADKKQALADVEALIKNLLDWANKQPEYTTGLNPDDDRIICPVDRLQLARYAEAAKSLLPPDRQEAFRNFAGAIGQNSIPGALITLSPLLDALCELRRKLGGKDNLKEADNAKKPKDTKKESVAIKALFKIEKSRILFNGVDLDLPAGRTVEIAKALIKGFDTVIEYRLLDSESTDKNAEDNLRKHKSIFAKKLKGCRIPCYITTKKQSGYMLTVKKTHSQTIHKQSR